MAKYDAPVALFFGDLHFPYANDRAIERVFQRTAKLNVTTVVQLGDLYDQYCFSKYSRDPDYGPTIELQSGREKAELFWDRVKRTWPDSERHQIKGNHDIRANKKISAAAPELKPLLDKSLKEYYVFDGVSTQHDPAVELFLDMPDGQEVCVMHGYRAQLGDHVKYNGLSTVCGHSHTGGVMLWRRRKAVQYELNAGWLGDERAVAFKYGEQRRLRQWTLGYGLIDANGPRFCPL